MTDLIDSTEETTPQPRKTPGPGKVSYRDTPQHRVVPFNLDLRAVLTSLGRQHNHFAEKHDEAENPIAWAAVSKCGDHTLGDNNTSSVAFPVVDSRVAGCH